jgi:DNA-binding PadR family transcriptional regulator
MIGTGLPRSSQSPASQRLELLVQTRSRRLRLFECLSLDNFWGTITFFDIALRYNMKAASREILLGFWKAHILYHAGESPIHGQWILLELRRHGYELSPGTLYPLLNRMERLGWIKGKCDPNGGARARKDYQLTAEGRKVLKVLREQIRELHREVVLGQGSHRT